MTAAKYWPLNPAHDVLQRSHRNATDATCGTDRDVTPPDPAVIRSYPHLSQSSVRAHEAAPLSPFASVSARPHLPGVAQGQRDIVARLRESIAGPAFDGTRQVVGA